MRESPHGAAERPHAASLHKTAPPGPWWRASRPVVAWPLPLGGASPPRRHRGCKAQRGLACRAPPPVGGRGALGAPKVRAP